MLFLIRGILFIIIFIAKTKFWLIPPKKVPANTEITCFRRKSHHPAITQNTSIKIKSYSN